ncbi:hypothetical protein FRUB_01430 [Fimbriiglobus ruber]|uniref:Uncharacterized protein n=1 Tax=Fimbriiglobus ruber TaxID=1908690 RepID=A0A225E6H7_9BACT|nr:hypothetical protein FRUB_01430 [Fimbriiglobus ruber]
MEKRVNTDRPRRMRNQHGRRVSRRVVIAPSEIGRRRARKSLR